ncbi:hypothetical protein RHSIM_Rhsim05G0121500 [Rhododendron simsii]|uniref:Protein FAR1-RELATED SEQUENCE n=1 Tax=Rhododendron simsii TaxID=118357 RepID=A0A834GUT5_RHOSS|nr:hypothetical protein RHSIM_Rhsim05G0121500 [Rhododendron simsii]
MQCLDNINVFSPSSIPCKSSANSSQILHTPQVKNDLIPKINQEFDNLDDVWKFYNNYGKEGGFGTRASSSKRNRDYEVIRKEYVCNKEGVKRVQKTSEPVTRRRGDSRENCGAKLSVVRNQSSGKFVVSQFVEGHNHHLASPKRVHLFRSHRKVSAAKKALVEQLSAANVRTCQQMSIFELQSGGLQNVGFLQEDLDNFKRDMRKMLAGQDANMLFEHFQIEQQKNKSFMYTMEKDDEGRMTHCFWADATSRKSYQYFGDVVVFDTTYNTNRYAMIFAPILGVNHHGQTTLFGCGFLSDETSDSFEWLFKEFLKAMPAGPPKMIITDQDLAMTKAFANVLRNTHHRYCIWHITPEEFDAKWIDVVHKANLSSNEWLKGLYEIRERWVPAYMKHMFFAHMTSSQRAEISHAFFKRYMSENNSLWDFMTRFDRALSKLRHNELDLDHKDLNEKPPLKTVAPMELTMSELYTRVIFYKFQDELHQILAYVVTMTHEDEHRYLYNVERVKVSGSRVRQILVEKSSKHASCSCKMFESDGIPCRHLLAFFSRMQVIDLPNEYILRRWTKSAKAMRVVDDLGGSNKEICDTSLLERRNNLFQRASNVIDDAVLTEDGTQILEEALCSVQKKLCSMNLSCKDGKVSAIQVSIPHEQSFKEPLKVRAKGCGKRLKGGKEKAVKKSRRCNGCGLTGQSHDKRNCPKLQNLSSQDVRMRELSLLE